MAIAICPDARLRKSTSSGVNGVSVLRRIDNIPRARPRLTSGMLQAAFTPSAAARSYVSGPSSSRSRTSNTTGFKVSIAFLTAALGATNSSSLMTPLPCGKSKANTPNFPEAASGSATVTASASMTSRILAATARRTSRRSSLDVILVVRLRSNCRRSFCCCNDVCAACARRRLRPSSIANATTRAIRRRKAISSLVNLMSAALAMPNVPSRPCGVVRGTRRTEPTFMPIVLAASFNCSGTLSSVFQSVMCSGAWLL